MDIFKKSLQDKKNPCKNITNINWQRLILLSIVLGKEMTHMPNFLSRDLIYMEEQYVTQCRLVVRLSTAGKGPCAGEVIVFIVSTDLQGDARA